jgi:hypothetical protein
VEIEAKFGKPIFALLYDLYCIQGLGIKACARKLGVSDRNLWEWFEALGIQRRERSDAVALQWVDNPQRRKDTANRFREMRLVFVGELNPSKHPEVRAKISAKKLGPQNAMYGKFGAANPLWKGGKITYRGAGWHGIKEQARRRDNYTCRRCHQPFAKQDLDVHHIVPYRDTQDNRLENLVTLCKPCHMQVEHHGATWD